MTPKRAQPQQEQESESEDAFLDRAALEGVRAQISYEKGRPVGRLVPLDDVAKGLMEQMGQREALERSGGFVTEESLRALERVASDMWVIATKRCSEVRDAMEMKRKAVAVTRYVRSSRRMLQHAAQGRG